MSSSRRVTFDLEKLDGLIGSQVYTKCMFTMEDVTGFDGRRTTYAALGDMPFTIKEIVKRTVPFDPDAPEHPIFILEQDKSPSDFKYAAFNMYQLVENFTSKSIVDFPEHVGHLVGQAFERSIKPEQKDDATPSTEGWGAWA